MSIRKRGPKTWQIEVYLGRDAVSGQKIRSVQEFHGTQTEAQKEERRLLRERDLGTFVKPEKLDVAEYLARWLRDYAKPNVAATTYEAYARICTRHIIPHIGTLPLAKVRPLHVQALYAKLAEPQPEPEAKPEETNAKDAAPDPRVLSGLTILHVHRVLSQAFKQAMRWQLVAVNPCTAVDPPRYVRKEMQTLTQAQTAELLEGVRGTRYYAPLVVAVTTGVRRGELLGLRWQDIDLEAGKLAVRQTIEQTSAGLSFKPPKTPKSRRNLSLATVTIDALKQHRKEQAAQRLEQGNTYHDNGLVFPMPDGRPWTPSLFSRMFHHHAHRLGFTCRLHDLRHTHATQLLAEGVHPKIASERLGHATVGITLDTYSHAVQGLDEAAADLVGAALERAFAKTPAKATKQAGPSSGRQ